MTSYKTATIRSSRFKRFSLLFSVGPELGGGFRSRLQSLKRTGRRLQRPIILSHFDIQKSEVQELGRLLWIVEFSCCCHRWGRRSAPRGWRGVHHMRALYLPISCCVLNDILKPGWRSCVMSQCTYERSV